MIHITIGSIILLALTLLVLTIYATFNLLGKVEKLEDVSEKQQKFIDQLQVTIQYSHEKLKEIDNKGIFESDDEIGWFFNNVKEIQSELDTFKGGNNNPLKP